MKYLDEINYYRKDWVHRNYARIVDEFKDYEKISKKKMLEEVFHLYENSNVILSICSYSEIMLLKKIIKGKTKYEDIKTEEKEALDELRDKFLVFHSEKGIFCVPDEIEKPVKEAINDAIKEDMEVLDGFNDLMVGLLKIYGAVTSNELHGLVNKYIEIDEEMFNDYIRYNMYFHFYCYYIDGEYGEYLVYEPYYDIIDELIDAVHDNDKELFYLYDLEDIKYLKSHRFDDRKSSIKKFLNEVYSLHFYQENFLNEVLKYSVMNGNREDLINYLKSIPALHNENLSTVINLMNQAMDDMPCAVFKGETRKSYNEIHRGKDYDNAYEKAYNILKDQENIKNYKKTRDKIKIVLDDCLLQAVVNRQDAKFAEMINSNRILFEPSDTNIVGNLVIFHSIGDEPSVFMDYYNKYMNILNVNYPLFTQIKTSYIEGLFIIRKLDNQTGQVTLEDVETKKKYIIMDIALSCADKGLIGSYLYTTLITIDNITFANEYGFVITKKKNTDILDEVAKKEHSLKNIYNPTTRKFIACYLLFKEEDIRFVHRIVE